MCTWETNQYTHAGYFLLIMTPPMSKINNKEYSTVISIPKTPRPASEISEQTFLHTIYLQVLKRLHSSWQDKFTCTFPGGDMKGDISSYRHCLWKNAMTPSLSCSGRAFSYVAIFTPCFLKILVRAPNGLSPFIDIPLICPQKSVSPLPLLEEKKTIEILLIYK